MQKYVSHNIRLISLDHAVNFEICFVKHCIEYNIRVCVIMNLTIDYIPPIPCSMWTRRAVSGDLQVRVRLRVYLSSFCHYFHCFHGGRWGVDLPPK